MRQQLRLTFRAARLYGDDMRNCDTQTDTQRNLTRYDCVIMQINSVTFARARATFRREKSHDRMESESLSMNV